MKAVKHSYPDAQVDGLDGMKANLQSCGMLCPGSRLFLQNIIRCPWNEDIGSYDVIAFTDVLEHIDDPVCTLKEAARHLHKNGVIIISLPASPRLWSDRDSRRYTLREASVLLKNAGSGRCSQHTCFHFYGCRCGWYGY